jgi:hypothetical protein
MDVQRNPNVLIRPHCPEDGVRDNMIIHVYKYGEAHLDDPECGRRPICSAVAVIVGSLDI